MGVNDKRLNFIKVLTESGKESLLESNEDFTYELDIEDYIEQLVHDDVQVTNIILGEDDTGEFLLVDIDGQTHKFVSPLYDREELKGGLEARLEDPIQAVKWLLDSAIPLDIENNELVADVTDEEDKEPYDILTKEDIFESINEVTQPNFVKGGISSDVLKVDDILEIDLSEYETVDVDGDKIILDKVDGGQRLVLYKEQLRNLGELC